MEFSNIFVVYDHPETQPAFDRAVAIAAAASVKYMYLPVFMPIYPNRRTSLRESSPCWRAKPRWRISSRRCASPVLRPLPKWSGTGLVSGRGQGVGE